MTSSQIILSAFNILAVGKYKSPDTKWKQLLLRQKYNYFNQNVWNLHKKKIKAFYAKLPLLGIMETNSSTRT